MNRADSRQVGETPAVVSTVKKSQTQAIGASLRLPKVPTEVPRYLGYIRSVDRLLGLWSVVAAPGHATSFGKRH